MRKYPESYVRCGIVVVEGDLSFEKLTCVDDKPKAPEEELQACIVKRNFSLEYGSCTQGELLTCYSRSHVMRNEFSTKFRNSLIVWNFHLQYFKEHLFCISSFTFFSPFEIQLMVFGIFLCLDAFLYVFTLLPVRVLLALFRLFTLPCYGLR